MHPLLRSGLALLWFRSVLSDLSGLLHPLLRSDPSGRLLLLNLSGRLLLLHLSAPSLLLPRWDL